MQCQRPCFQRILWTISSCCKKTHYTTTCTYPYLTNIGGKITESRKSHRHFKTHDFRKGQLCCLQPKHSNQTRSLKAPIFSPLAVFKGETPATSTHICGVVWRGKHGASEQQPGASQLHSSRFSILSFATDMSHSSIFPPLPAAPQRIQFHKAMPQDPDVTEEWDQRWIVDKEEEKPVRNVMKSKNKPGFFWEGPTANSSKQASMTWQYATRQNKTRYKSSLTAIQGEMIKQLNMNWTCFQVLGLALPLIFLKVPLDLETWLSPLYRSDPGEPSEQPQLVYSLLPAQVVAWLWERADFCFGFQFTGIIWQHLYKWQSHPGQISPSTAVGRKENYN